MIASIILILLSGDGEIMDQTHQTDQTQQVDATHQTDQTHQTEQTDQTDQTGQKDQKDRPPILPSGMGGWPPLLL